MTIQRQYSLPNCTLFLEGLSDSTTGNSASDARPVMSILVNAECRVAGKTPIAGGRDFFESLVKTISGYAQEFLSNVPHPHQGKHELPLVQMRRIGQNLHRLIVQNPSDMLSSNGATTGSPAGMPVQIDLTTVQLFDLVEAVDQFFADSQTLPDLSLRLVPVQRREAKTDEPVVKRATPAALGVSSLALAAIAFFFIPVPEVKEPKPLSQPNSESLSPSPTSTEQSNTGEPPLASTPLPLASPTTAALLSPSPSPTDSPTTAALLSPSPSATNSPTTEATVSPSPTDSPTTGAIVSPSPTDSPTAEPTVSPSPSATESPSNLTPTAAISDPTLVNNLNQQLSQKVEQAWRNRSGVQQDLIYRVTVDQNGTIVGYRPVNSPAGNAVEQTPLPQLLQTPTVGNTNNPQKSIAEFKVVFTPTGIAQVSPWQGLVETSTQTSAPEIKDSGTLRDLNRRIYNKIQENKQSGLKFPEELEYRVAVRGDGTIIEYEPRNQPAFNYVDQTPLPKLKSSATPIAPATGNSDSVGHFRVIFTRRGVLQVSPWYGYR